MSHSFLRLNKGFLNMIALSIYLDPKSKKLQPAPDQFNTFQNLNSFYVAQIPKKFSRFIIFGLLRAMNLKLSIRSQAHKLLLRATASHAAQSEKTQLLF